MQMGANTKVNGFKTKCMATAHTFIRRAGSLGNGMMVYVRVTVTLQRQMAIFTKAGLIIRQVSNTKLAPAAGV